MLVVGLIKIRFLVFTVNVSDGLGAFLGLYVVSVCQYALQTKEQKMMQDF